MHGGLDGPGWQHRDEGDWGAGSLLATLHAFSKADKAPASNMTTDMSPSEGKDYLLGMGHTSKDRNGGRVAQIIDFEQERDTI